LKKVTLVNKIFILQSLKKQLNYLNEKIYYTILIFSLIWLKEINYLFYDINESPDFKKYFVYFDHFFSNNLTNHEHGLSFYYIQALHLKTFFTNQPNLELALHKSVIDVNFYLFVIGLLGIYKLFKFFQFSNSSIALTLIFLNFFPPAISLRLVYKPEILAFSLFPWIIYLLEKFKTTQQKSYLLMAIPLLVMIVSLKGNILVIVCLYLLISNYKVLSLLKISSIMYLTLFLVILFSVITLENNRSNGKNILDIQSGASLESNYDFKAPKSIIYKTNLYKLFSSPIKHTHADSFIAITLLETSGDYFDLYWDNDASQYFKSRLKIFNFEQSNEIKFPTFDGESKTITIFQQRSTDIYIYETLSLILSIILFVTLFGALVTSPEYRIYLTAIFLGMAVILVHAITGYPKNNFDPLVGDTFKPLYYSFTLLFSFSFAIVLSFEKKIFKFRHLIVYCLLIVFILGFPKKDFSEIDGAFIQKIEHSAFCEVEKNIYIDKSLDLNLECNPNYVNMNTDYFFKNEIKHKPANLVLILSSSIVLLYLMFEKRLALFSRKTSFIKNK
jgi:hypothetical protein